MVRWTRREFVRGGIFFAVLPLQRVETKYHRLNSLRIKFHREIATVLEQFNACQRGTEQQS